MKRENYFTKRAIAYELFNYKILCLQQKQKTQKMLDILPDINRESMLDFIHNIQKIHKENLCSLCDRGAINVKRKNEFLDKLRAIHNYNELEEFLEDTYQQMSVLNDYDFIILKELFILFISPLILYLLYLLKTQL